MKIPNANKVCRDVVGGYLNCDKCPIYSVCSADYPTTEEFEKAVEAAAIEYLRGKENDRF